MKTKTSVNIGDLSGRGNVINIANQHHYGAKGSRRAMEYPASSIGADLAKRNYVKYLVERYHRCREADASFGRNARFGYAVIFKNIESKFGTPTYFVPEVRFAELVDYLHRRINQTILGKRNHSRGISNYISFDEYALECFLE